ncbi:MAG: hypothetical protein DELT_02514 [Desulfovibrio sp.]
MEAAKLLLVFLVIVIILKCRKPLPYAVAGGSLAASLLYGLGAMPTVVIVGKSLTSWSTISLLLIFYCITFLQRMLEKRGDLLQTEHALNALFNNRRVNASLAPMFIGLLPSAGAMTICGAIVNSNCGKDISQEQKTVITTYFRHIPEAFVPTYASILLGVELSGVPMGSFIMGTLPLVAVLIFLGYFFLLRQLPPETGHEKSSDKPAEVKRLVKSIWSLALIVILVIAFKVPVYLATGISIVLNVIVSKFSWSEIQPLFVSAFETRLLLNSALIMIFKDIVNATGVIETLPALFAQLPIPAFLIFFLIFFFGTIISGQQAITVICVPLAFAAFPDAGMPLLVLLLSSGYIAMQISPTHICLAVVTEYFHTHMGDLVKNTMPIVLTFIPITLGYYLLLKTLGL